jgi:hypothetical protein
MMSETKISSWNEERDHQYDDSIDEIKLEIDCYCGSPITISEPCTFCDGKGNFLYER